MNMPVPSAAVLGKQSEAFPEEEARSRILVVDDVADNRDILIRRLSRRGYEVIEARNGTEALERIADSDVDIVLLDIMMPDILGTDVVREVRKTRSASELPIIMVSAKSQSEDVAESLELGANDYVIKPVDFTVTLARIETQLKQRAESIADKKSRLAAESTAAELKTTIEESLAALDLTNEYLATESANRKRTEKQLHYMAYHDSLTGLANRFALLEKLEEALADDVMVKRDLAVLFIDLDRFKSVNDVHGHQVGDRVLREIARRLEAAMPKDSLCVARLGGDEFAAVFPCDGDETLGRTVGKRITEAACSPIMIDSIQVQIGASCGVASSTLCSSKASLLIKAADLAMYRAKKSGRGSVVEFEPSILEEEHNKSVLEVSLPGALDRQEFELYYQPLIDTQSRRISCFEALLRWQHPERGTIYPSEFIPVAEETGQITRIGAWVLRQACTALKSWPDHIRVAVNLSPEQFRHPELLHTIEGALTSSGVQPERLELEITESCLLDAGTATVETLTAIRELGVLVTIDDFGTGYSSMSYLQRFVFDKLKIDRRFVSEADSDPRSAAIVDAIIGLSSKMGTSTTAEGVETEAQLKVVVSQGCNEMQGFLFGAPMPEEEARRFIATYEELQGAGQA